MATQNATTLIQATSQSEYANLKAYLQFLGVLATYNDALLQATISVQGSFVVPTAR